MNQQFDKLMLSRINKLSVGAELKGQTVVQQMLQTLIRIIFEGLKLQTAR